MRTAMTLLLTFLLALAAACTTATEDADDTVISDDTVDAPMATDDEGDDDVAMSDDDAHRDEMEMTDDAMGDDMDMADDEMTMDDALHDDHDMGAMDDETFLVGMIEHHRGAVEMAEIALERSEREELQQIARDIIETQEEEISLMQHWLDEWYDGGREDHGMTHEEMGMIMDMDQFRDAEPFDLAFIDGMIAHHQAAIDMSYGVLATTEHDEVRELAEEIIEVQQAEIELMDQWRDEWYGK
jgi:uncharacterized protein (DUF305 family)